MISKKFLVFGAVLACLGVALGAFGAHALKNMLTEAGNLDTFETAVKYQFYHAFALIITGMLIERDFSKQFSRAGWAFLTGSIIFCGSLYLICFTGQKFFGAIAPIGGTAFIAGWIFLIFGIVKTRSNG